jgi:hypothetical protein
MRLSVSGGWILQRPIPGTTSCDAMGCYPLFCCTDWNGLRQDLDSLGSLVSVVLVADPLGAHSPALLRATFDHVKPFKDHFVVETGRPLTDFVSTSHRAHAMRALTRVTVDVCPDPVASIDDWDRLYGALVARHAIGGARRFSRSALLRQLAIPGLVMFRATAGGRTVGLDLWYRQGDCAQGHLAAFDEAGYELRASYATKWRAIEYFGDKVRWINLGGGNSTDGRDGLSDFKRGWSTGTKTAWLCGRVLQPAIYDQMARNCGGVLDAYFPAYRSGELA